MEKWSCKEESYIKSNARRNIYQKLDIYISGIRFYGAKDSEDVLQDGTNASMIKEQGMDESYMEHLMSILFIVTL